MIEILALYSFRCLGSTRPDCQDRREEDRSGDVTEAAWQSVASHRLRLASSCRRAPLSDPRESRVCRV